jgi:hypothetical protein
MIVAIYQVFHVQALVTGGYQTPGGGGTLDAVTERTRNLLKSEKFRTTYRAIEGGLLSKLRLNEVDLEGPIGLAQDTKRRRPQGDARGVSTITLGAEQ